VIAIDMRPKVEHVLVRPGKASRGAHWGVSTEHPAHNPYRVRLSELTRFRPMTATHRSALDPATDDDLLPTSTGQLVDEPEQRPRMLTIEGEIWGFGKIAEYAATATGPKATAARVWVLLLLLPILGAVGFEIAHLLGLG
jgi:hypothetical protein